MSNMTNEEPQSPKPICSHTTLFSSEYGVSPVSNLSADLGANLRIRRNLTFPSANDNKSLKFSKCGKFLVLFI